MIDTVLVNIQEVPEEYMNTNKFDEYLVQVEHDFEALKAEEVNVISNNFLKLRDGGAFHNGEAVAKEIVAISQRQEFRH